MHSQLFETQSLEAPRLVPGERSDSNFARRYPLNILIAEDNYTNRRLLLLMLKGLGYEAQATDNGRDCLHAMLGGSFDILLTDLNMPEMSGVECAAAMRQAGMQIPIIAITASEPELTKEQCFEVGMNGYMKKPVNFSELRQILKETSLRKWVAERNLATISVAAA